MSLDRVNILNIWLMIASCVIAYVVPFELFLLAYAILGPLHYLTQISWMHTKGYFTTGRQDYVVLVALCGGIFLLRHVLTGIDAAGWATVVVATAFFGALGMAFFEQTIRKGGMLALGAALGLWASQSDAGRVLLVTFMPTLVHVYLFTAAFILFGALRSRSVTGIASLAVFVACTASFALYRPGAFHQLGPYFADSYAEFANVNLALASWLGIDSVASEEAVYRSNAGVALMRFIAFAYTYHYLNWFSKTSVIQWHRIPRAWSAINGAVWLASLALYAWDYRLGLAALFSLSFLHVFLEFPLDYRTFAGIGRETADLITKRSS